MNTFDAGPGWAPGMDPFFSAGPSAAFQFWKVAMTLPAKLTVESLRFSSQRLKANAEHLERMLECQTADELIEEQSAFMTTAAKEYEKEAEAFAETLRTATVTTSQAA